MGDFDDDDVRRENRLLLGVDCPDIGLGDADAGFADDADFVALIMAEFFVCSIIADFIRSFRSCWYCCAELSSYRSRILQVAKLSFPVSSKKSRHRLFPPSLIACICSLDQLSILMDRTLDTCVPNYL